MQTLYLPAALESKTLRGAGPCDGGLPLTEQVYSAAADALSTTSTPHAAPPRLAGRVFRVGVKLPLRVTGVSSPRKRIARASGARSEARSYRLQH